MCKKKEATIYVPWVWKFRNETQEYHFTLNYNPLSHLIICPLIVCYSIQYRHGGSSTVRGKRDIELACNPLLRIR